MCVCDEVIDDCQYREYEVHTVNQQLKRHIQTAKLFPAKSLTLHLRLDSGSCTWFLVFLQPFLHQDRNCAIYILLLLFLM